MTSLFTCVLSDYHSLLFKFSLRATIAHKKKKQKRHSEKKFVQAKLKCLYIKIAGREIDRDRDKRKGRELIKVVNAVNCWENSLTFVLKKSNFPFLLSF